MKKTCCGIVLRETGIATKDGANVCAMASAEGQFNASQALIPWVARSYDALLGFCGEKDSVLRILECTGGVPSTSRIRRTCWGGVALSYASPATSHTLSYTCVPRQDASPGQTPSKAPTQEGRQSRTCPCTLCRMWDIYCNIPDSRLPAFLAPSPSPTSSNPARSRLLALPLLTGKTIPRTHPYQRPKKSP